MKIITILFLICSAFFSRADYWTQKADFGGIERGDAIGFSIGINGYIGLGFDEAPPNIFYNDFW